IALADALGLNASPRYGGTTDPSIIYLVFPGSGLGQGKLRIAKEIKSSASKLFREWGGARRLKACSTAGIAVIRNRRHRAASPSSGSISADRRSKINVNQGHQWQDFPIARDSGALPEPSALVRHPPASRQQRQRERQAPPDRQRKVHGHAQDYEQHPEDFAFHQENLTTDEHG